MGFHTLIVIILVLIMYLNRVFVAIALAIVITGWVHMARVGKGQILTLKTKNIFLAARTTGRKSLRILVKHLIPNVMGPVIIIAVTFSDSIGDFFEAFLSFIGLGIRPP